MPKCLSCQSEDVTKSKNDAGFVKTEKHKPRRMYHYICNVCGFVALYAEVEKRD